MSKVFISQEVNAVDYAPATQFGDLVFVSSVMDRLSPYTQSLNNEAILNKITNRLMDFDPENDYLICTGAPAHMAMCGSILGKRLRRLLVWDSREGKYFVAKL